MKIELLKSSGRCLCRGFSCPKNPKYTKPDRWGKSLIIKDTTCAAITMDSLNGKNTSYYCRDCIEIIHDEMRMILNPKLWIFL